MGDNGQLVDATPAYGLPSTREMVADRNLSHFNVLGSNRDGTFRPYC